MLSRLKFEIQPLVVKMLDQLPPDVWTSDHTTFLDPAMGGGQFLVEIQRRLRAAGHSDDNIAERVWGCETNILRVNYARNNKKLVSKHLFISEFLDHDWGNMKFDVIVGNPPYQSTEAVGKKLWPLFVEKSHHLCKEGGYLCMVTPATWMDRPNGKSMRVMTKDIFLANTLEWVDTRTTEYFNVGEKIVAWLIHKVANQGTETIVQTPKGSLKLIYKGEPVALSEDQQKVYDILAIVDSYNGSLLRDHVYNDVVTSISIDEQLATKMIHDKASKTRAPLFWTASNTTSYYLDRKNMRTGIKVILNKSGYYYQDKEPDKYMLIDEHEQYAIGAGALGLPCDSMKQAQNALTFLKSKLYQFYINNEKTSGFNTGIIKLPMLSTKSKWNDSKIYQHFGLSLDQIEFVETHYQGKFNE